MQGNKAHRRVFFLSFVMTFQFLPDLFYSGHLCMCPPYFDKVLVPSGDSHGTVLLLEFCCHCWDELQCSEPHLPGGLQGSVHTHYAGHPVRMWSLDHYSYGGNSHVSSPPLPPASWQLSRAHLFGSLLNVFSKKPSISTAYSAKGLKASCGQSWGEGKGTRMSGSFSCSALATFWCFQSFLDEWEENIVAGSIWDLFF